jgi:HlyD family secretion protein
VNLGVLSADTDPVPLLSQAGPVSAEVGEPGQEIKLGIFVAILFFVGLLGWAAFARMDAAAYAQGRLVVSGQLQSVQHRDGGVVGEILVKEGDEVARDQILVRLASAEVQAQEQSLSAQAITLLA